MYTYICVKCVLIYVPIYAIIYIVKEIKGTFTAEEIERSEDNAEYEALSKLINELKQMLEEA